MTSPSTRDPARCKGFCHCHALPEGIQAPPCCAECALALAREDPGFDALVDAFDRAVVETERRTSLGDEVGAQAAYEREKAARSSILDAHRLECALRRIAEDSLEQRDRQYEAAEAQAAQIFDVLTAKEAALATARSDIEGLRGALSEWVAAHDAEAKEAKEAVRVRGREYRNWPAMPKRLPKNTLRMEDLSPEEQRRVREQCAKDMAPINEAERIHRAARERLDKARDAARSALRGDAATNSAKREE